MLETIIVILIIMWLLGMFVPVISTSVGSLIHLLLIVILVVVVIRLLQGRRPLV